MRATGKANTMSANVVLQDVVEVLRFTPSRSRGPQIGGKYDLKLACGHTTTKGKSEAEASDGKLKQQVKCLECSRPDVAERLV